MKEKIYTIPVTEAFEQDCECPLCLLQSKLEKEYTDYYLGPALMEPDSRIDTNKRGFCRRHFELLYNRQENRLGLALETHTHLKEKLAEIKELSKAILSEVNVKNQSGSFFSSLSGKFGSLFGKTNPKGQIGSEDQVVIKGQASLSHSARLASMLTQMENSCTVCSRLEYTMDRYLDVIMYLWSKEADFRKIFSEKKGFCLVHLKMLLAAAQKYLNTTESKKFLSLLMQQQIEHLERIEQELEWFTKKFDYRNNDAPWGNSKDALPRSIQKLKGYCDFK